MSWFKNKKKSKYLYLLWSPFNSIWKVGITSNFRNRLSTIRDTTNATILPVFKVRLHDPKKVEQRILRHFGPWRVNWKGSGKTEWLRMPFFVTPLLILEFIWMKYMWLILLLVVGILMYSSDLEQLIN